ncbi:hypothetical protein H8E52_04315, partial [bacterium]|nr:hypothetical protein [bacterium]
MLFLLSALLAFVLGAGPLEAAQNPFLPGAPPPKSDSVQKPETPSALLPFMRHVVQLQLAARQKMVLFAKDIRERPYGGSF